MHGHRQTGLTLVELMVAISVLAISLSIGLPAFAAQLEARRLAAAQTLLQADLAFARQQALEGNRAVIVGAAAGWQNGWRVFVDMDGDGLFGSADLLLRSQSAQPVSISGNSQVSSYVRYNGLGESQLLNGGFQAGTLLFCSQQGSVAGRSLVINRSGRVRSEPLQAGDARCNAG